MVLAQVASTVPVDIMPGQNDPTNHIVPQQVKRLLAALFFREPFCLSSCFLVVTFFFFAAIFCRLQPLNPCLFPVAGRLSSLKSVTNPYEFTLGGVRYAASISLVGCANLVRKHLSPNSFFFLNLQGTGDRRTRRG